MTLLLAYFKGMGLGASLIMAIGAQNAFVLGQSVRRNYALLIAMSCSAIDVVLIFAGVFGLGALIKANPKLLVFVTFAGVGFLVVYGFMAFSRAMRPSNELLPEQRKGFTSAKAALITTISMSLLNPHVYLDTVVLLGSIGGQLPTQQAYLFAAGASTASILWFFSLAKAGALLAPYLSKEKHWQRLDAFIAITMWLIALNLLYAFIKNQ
jgi:L-lysine exporter family protein LysE/ArgO